MFFLCSYLHVDFSNLNEHNIMGGKKNNTKSGDKERLGLCFVVEKKVERQERERRKRGLVAIL